MIDFHTHILPNIDDGSRSIEETFNLIQEAKQAGFEGIVLTSHYIENYYETDTPEREVWVNAIKENLSNKNIDTEIYLGNEIYLSNNMMNLLIEGKAATINNTCYVLFEMPLNEEPMDLYNIIYTLQENKLIPVLAHPERYSYVQKEPELIYDLIQKGCLMQGNFGSILGEYGNKAKIILEKLLQNNSIHFLGSDVHREKTIYPRMPIALSLIEDLIGFDKVDTITKINPRLALANKRIDIEEPYEVKLTFKEKLQMMLKK